MYEEETHFGKLILLITIGNGFGTFDPRDFDL